MKRVTLLALLTLALPTTALANSMDPATLFMITPTQFINGIASRNFGLNFEVLVRGSVPPIGLLTIRTDNISRVSCSALPGTCTFNTGDVRAVSSTATLFTAMITSGTITTSGNNVTIIADLGPSPAAPSGAIATWKATFAAATGNSFSGASASLVAVPEPGTLGLLGTGVIGLAGMVRRRLKLGT